VLLLTEPSIHWFPCDGLDNNKLLYIVADESIVTQILGQSVPPPPLVTGAANNMMGQSWKTLVASAVGIVLAAGYLA
jgi:hypothetical protein